MNILEPVFAKVLDSIQSPNGKAIAMIGNIFEVKQFRYGSNTVLLNDLLFNFSDIQIMTPLFHKGVQIGIGDRVYEHVVIDCYKFDNEYKVLVGIGGNVNVNMSYSESEITSHTPLYRTKVETLEIGGVKYNKEEVENALKNIKPV